MDRTSVAHGSIHNRFRYAVVMGGVAAVWNLWTVETTADMYEFQRREGLEAQAAASVRWRQGLIPRPTDTEAGPHDFGSGGSGMRIQEL